MDNSLTYIAGFFDGEGGIGIGKSEGRNGRRSKYGKVFYLHVYVSNTNLNVLEFIHDFFGCGSLHEQRYNDGHNRKKQYRWDVACKDAAKVLEQLYPFLKVKREQAALALKFQKRRRHTGWGNGLTDEEFQFAKECYDKMKKLNKKGEVKE